MPIKCQLSAARQGAGNTIKAWMAPQIVSVPASCNCLFPDRVQEPATCIKQHTQPTEVCSRTGRQWLPILAHASQMPESAVRHEAGPCCLLQVITDLQPHSRRWLAACCREASPPSSPHKSLLTNQPCLLRQLPPPRLQTSAARPWLVWPAVSRCRSVACMP